LEIRKSPFNICEREGYDDLDFIEIVCRLPVLKKPFSDLRPWVNAIYYVIRRDASSNIPLDGFDPVERGACAYHLYYQGPFDPSLGDELLSVENYFLVRDDEIVEGKDNERWKENPYAFALFAPHTESALVTHRMKLRTSLTLKHKADLASFEEFRANPEGAMVNRMGVEIIECDKAKIRLKIDHEEQAVTEAFEVRLSSVNQSSLPDSEFDDRAKDAIMYRLTAILK